MYIYLKKLWESGLNFGLQYSNKLKWFCCKRGLHADCDEML